MPVIPKNYIERDEFQRSMEKLKDCIEQSTGKTEATQIKVGGMEAQITQLVKIADDNKEAIFGKGGSPGILTRLTSIEVVIADVKRLMWVVITLGIGLLGTTVYNIIIEHAAQAASAVH
jgi:hypothetical protein